MTSPTSTLARSTPLGIAARLDRLPVSRWHWMLTIVVGLAAFFDVYEIYMGGVLASVLAKPWGLTLDGKALLVGAPFFGMIFGAIVLGVASDRWGRRRMFMFNLGIYSLLSIAAAFSQNLATLVTFRLLAGVFMGAELMLIDTYLSEFLPKLARGRMIAVAYAVGFLGTPVAAGLGGLLIVKSHFLWDGWRWMLLAGGLGAALIFALRRNLPESARWLAERSRFEEADKIVSSIEETVASQTGKPLAEVQPDEPTPVKRIPFRAMFKPPYRRRTVMIWIFQILSTVGQYGFASLVPLILISRGYDITKTLTYTALSFTGAPVGALLTIPLVERFERKFVIIGASLVVAICGIIFGNATTGGLIVTMGIAITICNSIVSGAQHIYLAELFPTQVRSTAIGVAYSLSRLSAGLLPFWALTILAHFGANGVFIAAACVIVIMCLDVAILGPRTNGRSLEAVTGSGEADLETAISRLEDLEEQPRVA